MKPLVLVGFEPDWQALYINGEKVAEGHRVDIGTIFELVFEACRSRKLDLDTKLETTHVESDEMDEHGECEISDKLEDLPAGAVERISR